MSKDKDPNEGLADDATLATDIKDEDARKDEQLEYYGGDKDDLDDEDFSSADRGDVVTDDDEEGKDDEVEEAEKEEEDDESEDEGEASDDDEDDSDSDSDDSDSDDESSDEDDADDDEAEDDSDGDEVDDESDADEKTDRGIPRRRFNEVNERMKAAEADLAALKAEKEAEDQGEDEVFDFDGAEDEYMELLLDGKTKEAGAKRREIRAAEKADFKAEAKRETIQEVDQDAMQTLVDSLAVQAEDLFPQFNPKSDAYRPDLVRKVSTFMRGYQTEGVAADEALVSGIADVAEMYGLGDEDTESEDTEVDELKPPPKKKGKPIKKVKEKIKLAKQQGKSPAGEGRGSTEAGAVVPDVDQMTDEEIDALPAETLSRIRGDYVE